MAAVQDMFRRLRDRRSLKSQNPKRKQQGSKAAADVMPSDMQLSRPRVPLTTAHDNGSPDVRVMGGQPEFTNPELCQAQSRLGLGVDRTRLELPPIPQGLDLLPDISRDCPRSPSHVYDEIPAYAIDSRRDILRYIRLSELRKMRGERSLDLERVRDCGAYLVVPIKDTQHWDPNSRYLARAASPNGPVAVDNNHREVDQLDWFVAPQDQSSLYRESTEFPERYFPQQEELCWASGNIRAFQDYRGQNSRDLEEDDACATRLETCSEDSGVSVMSPSSHDTSDAMSDVRRRGGRRRTQSRDQWPAAGSARPHSDSDSSLYTTSALDSSMNNASLSDTDLRRFGRGDRGQQQSYLTSDPVRDRRPIQTHVYNVIKEDSRQFEPAATSGENIGRHDGDGRVGRCRFPDGEPRFRSQGGPCLDLNSSGNSSRDTASDGDDLCNTTAPSDPDYDFYLDKAKGNLLLKHLVQRSETSSSSNLDSSLESAAWSRESRDLTSVTSMSDLSILADEEIQQLTLGDNADDDVSGDVTKSKMAGPAESKTASARGVETTKSPADMNGEDSKSHSAFVPYKSGLSHRSQSCSAMVTLESSRLRSPPGQSAPPRSVAPGGDKLSCRATSHRPALGARRLSGSHMTQHQHQLQQQRLVSRTHGHVGASSRNEMLSEIMKKNHDRQILVLL